MFHDYVMTKYLISFPSQAMVLAEEEFPIVLAESHAVIEEAKAAEEWARKIATACRCSHELRELMFDPQS